MNIAGLKIDDLIQERIHTTACLVADISVPNSNVYYEIGYALALEKPVVLIVNKSLGHSYRNVRLTGIFDNIGWIEYQNSDELSNKLED